MSTILKVNNKNVLKINNKNVSTFNGASVSSGIAPCNITYHTYRTTIEAPTTVARGAAATGTVSFDSSNCLILNGGTYINSGYPKSYSISDGTLTVGSSSGSNYTTSPQSITIKSCAANTDAYIYALRCKTDINSGTFTNCYLDRFQTPSYSGYYNINAVIYVNRGYILDSSTYSASSIVGTGTPSIRGSAIAQKTSSGYAGDYPLYYYVTITCPNNVSLPAPFDSIKEVGLQSFTFNTIAKSVPNLKGTTWTFKETLGGSSTFSTFGNKSNGDGAQGSSDLVVENTFNVTFTCDGTTYNKIYIKYTDPKNKNDPDTQLMTYGDSTAVSTSAPIGAYIKIWSLGKTITFSSSTDIYDSVLYEFLKYVADQN